MAKILPQFLLTVLCNIISFFFGLHLSWLAPFQTDLEDGLTSIKPGLNADEISWLASLPTIVILVSAPIFGILLKEIGRKNSVLCACLPNIAIFGILTFATSVELAYLARILSGFVSAGAIIVPSVYVNECVEDCRRGFFGSQCAFFINFGVVVTFVFGHFGNYFIFNQFCLVAATVCSFGLLWLPESPAYLASKERFKEAKESLLKLGRSEAAADTEMEDISQALNVSKVVKQLGVVGVVLDAGLRRAMIICVVILATQQLSGVSATCSYLLKILQDVNKDIDIKLISVLLGLVQLAGSIIAPLLLIPFGRKTVLLFSGFIMSASLALLALTQFIDFSFEFTFSIGVGIYLFSYLLGYGSVPFVLMPEIVAPDGREVVIAIVGVIIASLSFSVAKFFYPCVALVGLGGIYSIYAVFSLFGTVFVYFYVFETRGKTTIEICQLLKGSK